MTDDPRDTIDPGLDLGARPSIRATLRAPIEEPYTQLAPGASITFRPDAPLTFEHRRIGRILEARPTDDGFALLLEVEIDAEHAPFLDIVRSGLAEGTTIVEESDK